MLNEFLNKPTKLSDDQRKAVLSKSRYNRIIAGPGAGKTETLTRRIAYLLLVEKVNPSSVVAFTFTEKAAQEMKDRIYQRIGTICGSSATANLGEMYIGTIHAYAKRILEDYFHFGNHGVLDENQEVAFMMRHGWDLGVNLYERNYAESCRVFLRTVNMVWGEMLNNEELEKKAPEFYEKLQRYAELLKEHRQLTFGRMVREAVLRLREKPDTLTHVKHLLVDEYQDINRAQEELINFIGKSGKISVVGDPRQCIYQWRGSDVKFFNNFSEIFLGAQTIMIRENRRSAKKIVANANKFAESFKKASYDQMESTRDDSGFVGISSHKTPDDEAKWIADQIWKLVKEKKTLRFSDIGILVRSVSTSAGPLINEFRRRGIPYIVGGTVGLFKRDEAQALGRIFSWFWDAGFWVENPWMWKEQVRDDDLLLTGLTCWNKAHNHGNYNDAEKNLMQIKQNLHNKFTYNSFTEIYQDVLLALGFHRLNHDDVNDAVVMANLGRFNVLLTDYGTANRIGGRTPKWERDLKGLCWFMNSHAVSSYDEQPSDDIRGVDAVQIMTIHQAKGLEWPIVFIFATVEGRFPSRMLGRKQNWCGIPREIFDAERYEGDIEDERRLFYVAITRARDVLLISHFKELNNRKKRTSLFLRKLAKDFISDLTAKEELPDVTINPSLRQEKMQTFSASEIINYKMCPYMYLLREVWGYQPGLTQAIGFGNSLHYCLRRAAEHVKKQGCNPTKAVKTSADKDFYIPFAGGEVFRKFKIGATKILMNYVKKYGDDLKRIEEVEYRLEYPIQNATIMGKVDVILKDGGDMEVREYKTSEKVRTFDETALQVRLYSAGLKALGRRVKIGSVVYLEKPEIKPVEVSESQMTETKKDVERTVKGIMKGQFNPRPGENCERCDYQAICTSALIAVRRTSFANIKFCVIDFETTGLDPKKDEVIEVGAIHVQHYKLGRTFHTLVQPRSRPISTEIAKITGLNMDMLMDSPFVDEVKADFQKFIENSVLVEHSRSKFDLRFLKNAFGTIRKHHHLNTLQLSKLLFPKEEKHDLESICKRLRVQLREHHHALDDAKATANVLNKFLKLLEETGYSCFDDLEKTEGVIRWL